MTVRYLASLTAPDAQALVKELCAEALAQDRRLVELAAERFPQNDWQQIADPAAQFGAAPAQALTFASRVRAL